MHMQMYVNVHTHIHVMHMYPQMLLARPRTSELVPILVDFAIVLVFRAAFDQAHHGSDGGADDELRKFREGRPHRR